MHARARAPCSGALICCHCGILPPRRWPRTLLAGGWAAWRWRRRRSAIALAAHQWFAAKRRCGGIGCSHQQQADHRKSRHNTCSDPAGANRGGTRLSGCGHLPPFARRPAGTGGPMLCSGDPVLRDPVCAWRRRAETLRPRIRPAVLQAPTSAGPQLSGRGCLCGSFLKAASGHHQWPNLSSSHARVRAMQRCSDVLPLRHPCACALTDVRCLWSWPPCLQWSQQQLYKAPMPPTLPSQRRPNAQAAACRSGAKGAAQLSRGRSVLLVLLVLLRRLLPGLGPT